MTDSPQLTDFLASTLITHPKQQEGERLFQVKGEHNQVGIFSTKRGLIMPLFGPKDHHKCAVRPIEPSLIKRSTTMLWVFESDGQQNIFCTRRQKMLLKEAVRGEIKCLTPDVVVWYENIVTVDTKTGQIITEEHHNDVHGCSLASSKINARKTLLILVYQVSSTTAEKNRMIILVDLQTKKIERFFS